MPETAKQTKNKTYIALLTATNSLQSGLLAKLLSEKLDADCAVIENTDILPTKTNLILLDCQGIENKTLSEQANQISLKSPNATTALINATNSKEHEDLLDWPHISGIFYSDTDQAQLIQGIGCLLAGEYWVPRRLLHHLLDKNRKKPRQASPPGIKLTKRERQILRLIQKGATNADISADLSVSEHTVKSHLYNVYKKIGVRNRLEAGNWVRDIQLEK